MIPVDADATKPCTAWIRVALCKLIYITLRTIVQFEIATGYTMNYLADTFLRP